MLSSIDGYMKGAIDLLKNRAVLKRLQLVGFVHTNAGKPCHRLAFHAQIHQRLQKPSRFSAEFISSIVFISSQILVIVLEILVSILLELTVVCQLDYSCSENWHENQWDMQWRSLVLSWKGALVSTCFAEGLIGRHSDCL